MVKTFAVDREHRANVTAYEVGREHEANLLYFVVDREHQAKWRTSHKLRNQLG